MTMTLEQKLRDNLEAAAEALVVPDAKQARVASPVLSWRGGFGYAAAGAAAALALAIPALLLWSGRAPSEEVGVPSTAPAITGTSSQGTLAPPTAPPTSVAATSPETDDTSTTIDEITVADFELALVAHRIDVEEPPTATVILQATRSGESEFAGEAVVGDPASFFWNSVVGAEAVCELSATPTEQGANIVVRMLMSASMGCSEPFEFELVSGRLVPSAGSAEDIARQFIIAWKVDDEDAMTALSTPDAMRMVRELPTPLEAEFSYCEGAAGSVYCTWEVVAGETVVRVGTEPPSRVLEVFQIAD